MQLATIWTHILNKIWTDYCILRPQLRECFGKWQRPQHSLVTQHNIFFVENQVQITVKTEKDTRVAMML